MNRLTIIGNLTRAPELRVTESGLDVCTFTVAVNRRVKRDAHPESDYIRVTAWRELGKTCAKYLDKGRKVCVSGPARATGYIGSEGTARATLEMTAEDVEFLTPRAQQGAPEEQAGAAEAAPAGTDADGYRQVEDDELPF